jgi:hypothetical protein
MIQQIKGIMNNANSPQMQMIMRFLNGKGITAQQAVEMLCQQRGIDFNAFMQQINSAMK